MGGCSTPDFEDPTTGHCYEHVFGNTFVWQDGEDACIAWGGHLAALTSQGEYDFVLAAVIASDDHNDDTWIGGHDPDPLDGVFEWSTGEAWDVESWATPPWKGGNPAANEGCVKIHDGFESAMCDAKPPKGYLCERP